MYSAPVYIASWISTRAPRAKRISSVRVGAPGAWSPNLSISLSGMKTTDRSGEPEGDSRKPNAPPGCLTLIAFTSMPFSLNR